MTARPYRVAIGGLMHCCLKSLDDQLAAGTLAKFLTCEYCQAGIEFAEVDDNSGGYWRWAEGYIPSLPPKPETPLDVGEPK